jgi:hypothetical protein
LQIAGKQQSTGCQVQIPTAYTFTLPLYYITFKKINDTLFRDVTILTTMLFRDLDVPSPTPSCWVG